jgi:hypothetical protein
MGPRPNCWRWLRKVSVNSNNVSTVS